MDPSRRTGRTTVDFPLAIALTAIVLFHGLLFAYDLHHPAVFLNADRASERIHRIQALGAACHSFAGCWRYLQSGELVGDYAVAAAIFHLFGAPCLILAQILVFILSVYVVFRTCLIVGLERRSAIAGMMLYSVFPHSIVDPHVLSSEAWFKPAVILGFFYFCKLVVGDLRIADATKSAAWIGGSMLIRPISLLWPAVSALVVAIRTGRYATSAAFALMCFVPLAVWVGVCLAFTGHPPAGKSDHDLGHLLYRKIEFSSRLAPSDRQRLIQSEYLQDAPADEYGRRVAPTTYLSFAVRNPFLSLKHVVYDGENYFLKSDVERLTLDYFQMIGSDRASMQNPGASGWRTQFERQGPVGSIGLLLKKYPVVVCISLVGAGLLLSIWALFLAGAVDLARRLRRSVGGLRGEVDRTTCLMALALFPFYVFVVSFVADTISARLRAPAEFSICIVAVYGSGVLARLLDRHGRSGKPGSAPWIAGGVA